MRSDFEGMHDHRYEARARKRMSFWRHFDANSMTLKHDRDIETVIEEGHLREEDIPDVYGDAWIAWVDSTPPHWWVDTVHARYEVCGTCDGRGSHVNPSIDAHGITAEEFHEDPDFAEEYMAGRYDVPCYECDGMRVVPGPDYESIHDEAKRERLIARVDAWYEGVCQSRAEELAERRAGC